MSMGIGPASLKDTTMTASIQSALTLAIDATAAQASTPAKAFRAKASPVDAFAVRSNALALVECAVFLASDAMDDMLASFKAAIEAGAPLGEKVTEGGTVKHVAYVSRVAYGIAKDAGFKVDRETYMAEACRVAMDLGSFPKTGAPDDTQRNARQEQICGAARAWVFWAVKQAGLGKPTVKRAPQGAQAKGRAGLAGTAPSAQAKEGAGLVPMLQVRAEKPADLVSIVRDIHAFALKVQATNAKLPGAARFAAMLVDFQEGLAEMEADLPTA